MSLGSIFIGTMLLILTIPFIANPLLNKKGKKAIAVSKQPVLIANQYDNALLALRDLDFDYHTGKLTEEDYAALRADLLVRAAQERDAKTKQENDLDALLENTILAHKKIKSLTRVCGQCGASQSLENQFCSACGSTLNPVCRNCGSKIEPADLYCTRCGQSTKLPATPKAETVP